MLNKKEPWHKLLKNPALLGLGLFCFVVAACGSKDQAETSRTLPPPAVVVAQVTSETVPIYGEYVARTEARKTVEIRARVEGFLEKALFKEGSEVKAGQLLMVIDQRPYQAALQDARGSLAQARAGFEKAEKDVERLRPLVAEDAAAQVDLDKAEAEAHFNRAAIERAKAVIAKAELDLKFTEIHSPITGIIGKEEVAVGNLVTRDRTLLTTVSSWDPMRVVFSISESEYLTLAQRYGEGEPLMARKQGPPFELVLADNAVYPHRGRLSFVDRALDLTTGTLNVYASFPNPNRLLRPGMFGRIRVVLEERPNAILVPQRAVQVMQGVKSVLVVGPDNKVALRTVTLGERYKDFFIVTGGLKAGDRVVVEGLQKAIPGQKVTPTAQPVSQEQKGG
jgi:membrane fusion protein (multidrug efflux system)